ncbi:hypothetical protein HNP87_001898 [Methanococcus maripaludis]|uniref:DUF2098 family protein n=1 Tax=Methanococcus maripaludis TaxID=39152 RepID=A0A7J9NKY0_METMI|nr:DUF2098 family protein [Methanococcus maripaludis]MBA2841347.1 hypothetical protein [Methanococcus maripaludis]
MTLDRNGKLIEIGSYVKYINTGTHGTVKAIEPKNDEEWVLLENDIYYRPELLELVERKKIEKKESEEKLIERITNEDIDLEAAENGCGCSGAG